jgi:hypothetical protein
MVTQVPAQGYLSCCEFSLSLSTLFSAHNFNAQPSLKTEEIHTYINHKLKIWAMCVCKRNITALSRNHFYRGKRVSIIYSECVPAALVI